MSSTNQPIEEQFAQRELEIMHITDLLVWKSEEKVETTQARKEYKETNVEDKHSPKYSLWFYNSDEKRSNLRVELRCLHLASNFLRGTPYKKVERKCKVESRPTPRIICAIVEAETKVALDCQALREWVEAKDE